MSAIRLDLAEAETLTGVRLIRDGSATQALHDAIVAYQANRRQGTRATKTKGTVKKSGRKPWAQKGTGRARAGYVSSPIWRGGGVVFGPQPREFDQRLPKKVRRLALVKAFSERVKEGAVWMLEEEIRLEEPKTKKLVGFLSTLGVKLPALLIVKEPDRNLLLAARNHPELLVCTSRRANAEDLLTTETIVITRAALEEMGTRLGARAS
ncbi:50S ribosomal protein L4 [Candidatus Methylacidithermus pantelleriae]|uniref:Large ribosomal subunit protein uL4 n=1 Tax=Candidatus Methylacidithermus pantelleriae TaxID=2744239 RepID=A0A8J2BK10_9BACT|nr:50S ribosomal protein L4 [Candidatus Methylacidithermus pantelleriae]CAF0698838.1 50S ribosomal subunit protein L4 [Candidatus Methylacidithermus pantelleriae]